jgi:hypothetical protein
VTGEQDMDERITFIIRKWKSSSIAKNRYSLFCLRKSPQKVDSMSAAFIEEVMLFEPQNRSFLEFDLLPSHNQLIGS